MIKVMVAFIGHHKLLASCILIGILLVLVVLSQLLWLKYNGTPVPPPDISRETRTQGTGPALTFVVLGDSTTVSQGSEYSEGYAYASAAFLAQTHTVTWANYGVSGARAADVAEKQVPQAVGLKPDLVLIGVGANDVTHATDQAAVIESLEQTVAALRQANPQVRIILTGAPDMGSPPRLPQPLRWLAGNHTKSLNVDIEALVQREKLTFAPIAKETGPAFRRDHSLFAADNFHPNGRGYALWNVVVQQAIIRALN
jgi:acyl-CoA thioesterase I